MQMTHTLTEAEQQQILYDWNRTETPSLPGGCLHEWFAAQAERTPDAVAVDFEGQTLTYRELEQRANRLAHFLYRKGVSPDRFVGICTERSLEMMVGLLGILKAGGAYVPIDPHYPQERVAFLIEDSGIDLLLTQAHLIDTLPQSHVQLIALDERWPEIEQESAKPVESGVQPEHLAYMIYTSGSTGKPKGVLTEHRNAVNFTSYMMGELQTGSETRMLQLASFSFDASVLEFFTPLFSGGTLYLANKLKLLPGPELVRFAQEKRITHSFITPAVLRLLNPQDFPDLHTVTCGGEAWHADLVQKWGPGRRLYNGYGPTETTVITTMELTSDPDRQPPIGRPIDNTQAYVLDPNLQPLPVGESGELYIGGAGVARGYWNRPDLTAERFLPNPFRPGERIYKTGDLVRWLPEGKLEYVGRIDNQVKIRGFRIELGEVETAVSRLEGVQESAVVLQEDETGEKRLVAYVVLQAGAQAHELRTQLQAHLPEFMVPSVFVPIDAIPLTPNCKADTKSLAALPLPTIGNASYAEAEESDVDDPTRQKLLSIWREEFGSHAIGLHDDFFQIGGHSLLAMRILARMNDVFGELITIQEFFDTSTVAQLAAKVEKNLLLIQGFDSMSEAEIERMILLMEENKDGKN